MATIPIPILSPGASTETQRARIYLTAADNSVTTAAEVAYAWSSALGAFAAAATVSLAEGGPYQIAVRKVATQDAAGFDGGRDRLKRGLLGWVAGGALVDENVQGATAGQGTIEADGQPRYVLLADAPSLILQSMPVPIFAAASSTQQDIALAAATRQIDTAIRYQGAKYDPAQLTEFPRAAYGPSLPNSGYDVWACGRASDARPDVWDWDAVNGVAVVPLSVKRACLYQADALLNPQFAAVLDRMWQGLTSQKTGGMAETYNVKDLSAMTLCRQALAELEIYRLRQGRLL